MIHATMFGLRALAVSMSGASFADLALLGGPCDPFVGQFFLPGGQKSTVGEPLDRPELQCQAGYTCVTSMFLNKTLGQTFPFGCVNDEKGFQLAVGRAKLTNAPSDCREASQLGYCKKQVTGSAMISREMEAYCCQSCHDHECSDAPSALIAKDTNNEIANCSDAVSQGACTNPKYSSKAMHLCCSSCVAHCGSCNPTPSPTPAPPKICNDNNTALKAGTGGQMVHCQDAAAQGGCNIEIPEVSAAVRSACCASCKAAGRRLTANAVAQTGSVRGMAQAGLAQAEQAASQATGHIGVAFPGVCLRCNRDHFCPIGTITPSADMTLNLCPMGFYCPPEDPSLKVVCPQGYFCPPGTHYPYTAELSCAKWTCEYQKDGVWQGCKGAFCPPGSKNYMNFCPPGLYCPDPSQNIICPEGHFCPKGVRSPLPCTFYPTWQLCPRGSENPTTNWFSLFCLLVVALILYLASRVATIALYCRLARKRIALRSRASNARRDASSAGAASSLQAIFHQPSTSDERATSTSTAAAAADGNSSDVKPAPMVHQNTSAHMYLAKTDSLGMASGEPLEEPGELLEARTTEQRRIEEEFSGFKVKGENMSFQFDNLGLEVKVAGGKKRVLQGVSGEIEHSTLVAVMGPSGAGKTTFMNTLCGRAYYGEVTGSVRINNMASDILEHRHRLGFVPQDDIVHEDLTVEENLVFSALLRLPADMSYTQKYMIVLDSLKMLQISHIRTSIVGSVEKRGISGGQRKRVNIGLELCADPTVLFLDEPTSGLDSTSSEVVLGALKDMTSLGVTVITVIHQPRYSIFCNFDQVLLLGVGGRTVYSGPARRALPYFQGLGFHIGEGENPADFLMDVISGVVPRDEERQILAEGDDHNNFKPSDLFLLWDQHMESGQPLPPACAALPKGVKHDPTVKVAVEPMFKPVERVHLEQMFDMVEEATNGEVDAMSGLAVPEGEVLINSLLKALDLGHKAPGGQHSLHSTFNDNDADASRTRSSASAARATTLPDMHRRMGGARGGRATGGLPFTPQRTSNARSVVGHAITFTSTLRRSMTPFHETVRDTVHASHKKAMAEVHGYHLDEVLTPALLGTIKDWLVDLMLPHQQSEGANNVAGAQQQQQQVATVSKARFMAFVRQNREVGSSASRFSRISVSEVDYSRRSGEKQSAKPVCKPLGLARVVPNLSSQIEVQMNLLWLRQQRMYGVYLVELFVMAFAAVMVGWVTGSKVTIGNSLISNTMILMLFFGVLATVSALSTFGNHRLMFWRNAAAGCSTPAYFLAALLVDMPMIAIRPLFYFLIYITISAPPVEIWDALSLGWCLSFFCSGMGYLFSLVFPPRNCVLVSVLICILVGVFLAGSNPKIQTCPQDESETLEHCHPNALDIPTFFSYSRLGIENYVCTFMANMPDYMGDWDNSPIRQVTQRTGFCSNVVGKVYWSPLVILIGWGLVTRIFSGFLIIGMNRNQKIQPPLSKVMYQCCCSCYCRSKNNDDKRASVPTPSPAEASV